MTSVSQRASDAFFSYLCFVLPAYNNVVETKQDLAQLKTVSFIMISQYLPCFAHIPSL